MANNSADDPNRMGAQDGAQIYQKRSGLPFWLWPLLAVLLLGLLYALLHHNRGADQAKIAPAASPVAASVPAATGSPTAVTAASPDAAGSNIKVHSGTDIATARPGQASVPGVPLSNVVFFAPGTDPATFIGRRAKLTNVTVQKVISDRAFFIGPNPQQQILVLMDKGLDAGTSGNAKVTVASGQPVSLIGVVEAMPTQEAINQAYGVSGADYTSVQSQKAYLHATVAQQK